MLWKTCKLCQQTFSDDFEDLLEDYLFARDHPEGMRCFILYNDFEQADAVSAYEVALRLCDRVDGEDNWSSDIVFQTHFSLAKALPKSGRFDEALDRFLLVQVKFLEHMKRARDVLFGQWSRNKQRDYDKALPLLEAIHEEDSFQEDNTKIHLGKPCLLLHELLRVHKLATKANGSDDGRTLELIDPCAEVVSLSYNSATTRSAKEFPDGTLVEIKGYL